MPLSAAGGDYNKLMQLTEFSLRKAKLNGRNTLSELQMDEYREEEVSASLLNELTHSVREGCKGFYLVYQPQVRTGTLALFGAEALLRYSSPTRGKVYPDEFIPVLERFDLMYDVGLWVLKEALEQCKKWRELYPDFHMNVNMSYAQLAKPQITQDVLRLVRESGLDGIALTIEVTESMQLQKYQYFNEIFAAWKGEGISISVDEFGTGYSSLSYLKHLNIDEVKIDRCFVSGINVSSYNYQLVSNMFQLAAEANIRVCCEGVENAEELKVLTRLGSMLLQGYLFSRPCTTDVFERVFFLPDAPEYHEYMERVLAEEDSDIVSYLDMHTWDVLHSVSVGLWVLRIVDDGDQIELYVDDTLRRMLGMTERLSPKACYEFWRERMSEKDQKSMHDVIRAAIESSQTGRLCYMWDHPTRGLIEVRSIGTLGESVEGEHRLQGCHWIAEDAVSFDWRAEKDC